MGTLPPPPPLPGAAPAGGAGDFLRPSAHFLAIHPAFAPARGASGDRGGGPLLPGFYHKPPIVPPAWPGTVLRQGPLQQPVAEAPEPRPGDPEPRAAEQGKAQGEEQQGQLQGERQGEGGDPGEYYVEEEVLVMTEEWADHFRQRFSMTSGELAFIQPMRTAPSP